MTNPELAALYRVLATKCYFYLRATTADGSYTYDAVNTDSCSYGGRGFETLHPPAVGDLLSFYDKRTETSVGLRVIERSWSHTGYGSANWPVIEPHPISGPLLTLICEADQGPFRDEASTAEGEDA